MVPPFKVLEIGCLSTGEVGLPFGLSTPSSEGLFSLFASLSHFQLALFFGFRIWNDFVRGIEYYWWG